MQVMKAAVALLATFAACATPGILEPATGPNTEYPCGVDGVVCLTPSGTPSGMCCDQYDVCGGVQPNTPVTCPDGMCCYARTTDYGKRAPHPQRRANTGGAHQ